MFSEINTDLVFFNKNDREKDLIRVPAIHEGFRR